jgi:hypothetical protein
MVVIKRESTLLVVTEKGLGKCSEVSEYRVQKRGGKGILTLNRTAKTGDVVALMEVVPEDELMLMTRQGIAIRSTVSEIRVTGRAAQGVKLVALDENDVVSAVARVIPDDKDDGLAGTICRRRRHRRERTPKGSCALRLGDWRCAGPPRLHILRGCNDLPRAPIRPHDSPRRRAGHAQISKPRPGRLSARRAHAADAAGCARGSVRGWPSRNASANRRVASRCVHVPSGMSAADQRTRRYCAVVR